MGVEYEISAALIPILATIDVIRLETSRFGAGESQPHRPVTEEMVVPASIVKFGTRGST